MLQAARPTYVPAHRRAGRSAAGGVARAGGARGVRVGSEGRSAACRRSPGASRCCARGRLQDNVAAARKAAQANRLDEAARLYEQAIAASPDSAFLVRDLADVEAKQGKTDEALARYRRAIEMDPSDAASRTRIGEMLDARGDLEGAMKMYTEANDLEPSAELRRRIAALDARLAYLQAAGRISRHSRRSRRLRGATWRRSSASGWNRCWPSAPAQPVVITDTRSHWAADWIMATAQRRRDRALREPHVPACARRHAQRSRAGRGADAEDHRGGPARSF